MIKDVVYRFYNADENDARFFASNNIAMARELFHELGGFDTGFPLAAAEDRDLCDRWIHRDLKLVYEPLAVVRHSHPLNPLTFWKQHFNYGRGAYLYHRLRSRRQSGRMWDDTRMHFKLPALLREPLSSYSLLQLCQIVPLLILWQIANAAGFFRQQIAGPRDGG